MMSDEAQAVAINILGKEYLISCPEEERNELVSSADFLDKKMREIRDSGKVIGTDRIAVIAALNLANELLHEKGGSGSFSPAVESRIKNLQEKIEDALFRSKQLEL